MGIAFLDEQPKKPSGKSRVVYDDGGNSFGPKSGVLRQIADVPIGLAGGVAGLIPAAVGLGDIATGGRVGNAVDVAGSLADKISLPDALRPTKWQDQIQSYYTPEMKAAKAAAHQSAVDAEQQAKDEGSGAMGQIGASALGALKGAAENPRAGLAFITENYGGMKAIAKGTEKVLARYLPEIDAAVNAGTMTQAQANARVADLAGKISPVGEGILTAGQGAQQVRAENPGATAADYLLQAPAGFITGAIARGVGRIPGLENVEATMALNAMGRPSGFTGGVLKRAGKGVLSEGVLQEVPQSAQEQAWVNAGTGKPLQEGVGESAVQGLIAGGAMGGGAAGMSGVAEHLRAPAQGNVDPAAVPGQPSTTGGPAQDTSAQALVAEALAAETAAHPATTSSAPAGDHPLAAPIAQTNKAGPAGATISTTNEGEQQNGDQTQVTLAPKAGQQQEGGEAAAAPAGRADQPAEGGGDVPTGGQDRQGVAAETQKSENRAAFYDGLAAEREQPGPAADPVRAVQYRAKAAALRAEAAQSQATATTGEAKVASGWKAFPADSGTLGIARADMPQIKSEHRGALVNFLAARGVSHRQEEVDAGSLMPTQAEFSPAKVKKAAGFTGNNRSILVSADNHVLDGHHQWLAALAEGKPVKVVRLDAPISKLVDLAHEFPSSTTAKGAKPTDKQSLSVAPSGGKVAEPKQKGQTPIMRRDDLVGAIMRVTGGAGINSSMALDTTGYDAGKASKLRGMFTNRGTIDLDDTANLLRIEEGYDVRDGAHLSELIRQAAAGDVPVSMKRMQRDKEADQERQHRDMIRAKAKKLGVRTVGVKAEDVGAAVLEAEQRRHALAVEKLTGRDKKRFDAAATQLDNLVSDADVASILQDIKERGLAGRKMWNEALVMLRLFAEDARHNEQQGILDNATATSEEPDWFKEFDDEADSQPGARSAPAESAAGDGSSGQQEQGRGHGEPGPVRSSGEADGQGDGQETRFELTGQSAAEVAADEAAKAAEQKAAANAAEQEAKDKKAAEQKSLDDKIKARAANPDNFQFGEDSKAAGNPTGGLFDQPLNHAKKEIQETAPQPADSESPVSVAGFKHSRTGVVQYSVAFNDRVSPEIFAQAKALASRQKVRYSAFKRDGAIPGFLFNDEATAKTFAAEIAKMAPPATNAASAPEAPSGVKKFANNGDSLNDAQRELRGLSHDKDGAGDVALGNGKFVSFEAAVRLAREGIGSGAIRPFPAQLNFLLDLTMRDVDRVLAAATSKPEKKPVTPQLPPAADASVSANTIFTESAADAARALLKKKLGQLSAGIDPEIMQAGITLAGYHIEKGARTFAAYAKAMIGDLGDAVRPYLKSWYMGVKFDPRAAGFEGMDSSATVEAASIDDEKPNTSAYDEIGTAQNGESGDRGTESEGDGALAPVAPGEVGGAGGNPGGIYGYSSQPESFQWAAKEVGGAVVYSRGDIALVEGFSPLGNAVYAGVKGGSRTRADISAYTGKLFSESEKAELEKAKADHVQEQGRMYEKAPDGPFSNGARFAKADGVSDELAGVAQKWLSMLGIKSRVFVAKKADVSSVAAIDKYNLRGPFSAIRSAGTQNEADGGKRTLPNGDHYIILPRSARKSQALEALAHEIGHILEADEWKGADRATKDAVMADYQKWLDAAGNTSAADWVKQLRAHTSGKLTRISTSETADRLPPYWRSFSEYFADQVSRWATTSDKPLTAVDTFFKRIALAMRRLYAMAAGRPYLPGQAMKAYLDARGESSPLPISGSLQAEGGKQHRYALVNRPAGIGAIPKDMQYTVEPRPPAGQAHHDMARHGILVTDRELTKAEQESFELAPIVEGKAEDALADQIASGSMSRYAAQYVEQFSEDRNLVVQAVMQQVERAGRYSIADRDAFVAKVVDRMKAQVSKPTAEAAPAKAKAPEAKGGEADTATINDFGEKLDGARKDYAAKMRDAMDVDVASQPLSKSWPEPDYQKLLDGGADPYMVAFIRAARDELPTKPQSAWKLSGWVKQAEVLRGLAQKLLSGNFTADRVKEMVGKDGFRLVRDAVGGRAELYELVGHDRSLKGVTFASHHFSLYKGQENVSKWIVEQKAKATAFSNWPRELAVGDTKEEALEAFKGSLASMDLGREAKRQPQFVIYRKRGEPGAWVGKKIGREYIDLHKAVDVVDARKYMGENLAALEAALSKYKETPLERKADNQPRVGDDHRNGSPVTPDAFSDAFGFRGVQFGNYVEQGRRQSDLNEAFDGLMDLAAVLGVPPRALSLNGQLGLAFGARGKGGKNAPAAHFEPGRVVINLTKGGGPGSLAHEWWHSLDNYFAKQAESNSTGFVTDTARTDGLREEMRAAFAAVKSATSTAAYRRRSAELDKRRSKPYWDTPHERSARAFEGYVIAKLFDQGAANDYLANVISNEAWDITEDARAEFFGGADAIKTYPYPTVDEMPSVRAAFDEFFKTVESKETDDGNVMLFNQAGQATISPSDSAIYDMAAEGKSAAEILDFIGQASRRPFNQYLARALKSFGVLPTVKADEQSGWILFSKTGNKYGAAYNNKTDTVALFERQDAEHHILHEFTHAATLKAIAKGGPAATQMNALFEHVQADGSLDGQYGMSNIKEFVAEAFSNTKFQIALKSVPAPRGSSLKNAWQAFVRMVARILGFKSPQMENALDRAMVLGAQLMRENAALGERSVTGNVLGNVSGNISGDTITIDGVERPRMNSNGKPIAQTDEALRKFYAWFGDSKVVDEHGRPLVVYHGTDTSISQFNPRKRGSNTGASSARKAFWFSSSSNHAEHFNASRIGNNVMPAYLSLKSAEVIEHSMLDAYDAHPAVSTKAETSRLKELSAATRKGLDGVVFNNTFDTYAASDDGSGAYRVNLYAVFRPEQIKSATGNTGEFSPDNPDINFNAASGANPQPVAPRNAWQKAKAKAAALLTPERIDKVIYELQDKFIDLRRLRDHIKSIGGAITDMNDAYLGEELYHKRVAHRTESFLADEMKPLLAEMHSNSVGQDELETFLHARHAPEANAEMAKRNPNQREIDAGQTAAAATVRQLETQLQHAQAAGTATAAIEKALNDARGELSDWNGAQAFRGTEDERLSLSGMSDADARLLMSGLSVAKRATLDSLAARVDAINAGTMQLLDDYGLMSKDVLRTWGKTYQHYVPLHRDEAHPDSLSHPIGQGFSTKGDAAKRRTGSNAKVTNILGHIAMQRESALTRGEKNHVMLKLYLMARQNPLPDVWKVGSVPTLDVIDKKTGFVRTVPDPLYKNRPNVVMLRIAGKDVAITMNEHNPEAARMAQALKNLDVDDLHYLIPVVGKITRYFAAINTQYNPIFGLINLLRDTQEAALNLSTTPIAGKQGEVLRDTLSILKEVLKNKGRMPKAGPWAALFDDLREVGGTTGYRDLFLDAESRSKALLSELKSLDRGNAAKAWHGVTSWLSDYNEAMENATRLAAYKAALDSGMSKERAASLAKNLTVNFNRKGRQTRELGALYAFFNAAVQGTARMAQTLAGPAGRKIMAGGVMLGALNTLIGFAAMGGGDGDDDEWEKIPEFVKQRSIIIPIGKQDYITIPMPLGFQFLPNIGRLTMEMAIYKDKTAGKQMASLFSVLADAFNPLGGSSPALQIISPTVMDPFVALAQNKDWTGQPIYRENRSALDPDPGFKLAKDSATPIAKGIAEAINYLTGGTEYTPGGWSPTPDQIDYIAGQLTGGVGREIGKATSTAAAPFTGEELPAYKIPLVGRLYGNTKGASGESQKFYENITRANEAENEIKGRLKGGLSVSDYLQDNPTAMALAAQGNAAERQTSLLRSIRRGIVQKDPPDKAAQVREINNQIAAVMRGFNRSASVQ